MIKIYTIQDRLSLIYSEPIFKINDAVMKRYFDKICVNSPEARPEDYDLFCIGEYDEKACLLMPYEQKQYVMNGSELYETK